jgi:hypothetical protein
MKGFSDTKYRNVRLDMCFNTPFGGKTSFNILEVIPKLHLVINPYRTNVENRVSS